MAERTAYKLLNLRPHSMDVGGSLRLALVPALITALLLIAEIHNHVIFHILAELLGALVGALLAGIGWYAYPFSRNRAFLYLSSGYLWVGALAFAHAMAYPGVALLGPDIPHFAIKLWLVGSALESLLLASAMLVGNRMLIPWRIHLGFGISALLLYLFAGSASFPAVYVEGKGATPFQIASKYAIVTTFVLTLVWLKRLYESDRCVRDYLIFSILCKITAGLAFTLHDDSRQWPSVLGHILTVLSNWIILSALVRTTLQEPFRALAREASVYEGLPDPTLVVDRHGQVRQANGAARALKKEPVGRHCHGLFHPAGITVEECPVCRQIAGYEPLGSTEWQFHHEQKWIQITISSLSGGREHGEFLHVIRDITDTRLALQASQKSEQRYHAIMKHASDAIVVVDARGRFIDANDRAEVVLGYTHEELLALHLQNIYPSGDHKHLRTEFSDMRLNEGALKEYMIVRKDGALRPVEVALTRITLCGESVFVGILRDVYERKMADLALRESEERYRMLLDNLPQCVFLKDSTSVYLSCNRSYAEKLGIDSSAIRGKTDFDFFETDLAFKYRLTDREVMQSGVGQAFEEIFIKGDVHWTVMTVKTPIRDVHGRVVAVLGIFWDITRQKEAELALLENETLLRTAEKIARIGSWDWNLVTGEMRWSAGFYRIFGMDPTESPSLEKMLGAMPEEERDKVRATIMDAVEKGYDLHTEHSVVLPTGGKRMVYCRGSVKRNEAGQRWKVIGTAMDVTERKRVEEELRFYREDLELLVAERTAKLVQANKELESFSYTVSHDLHAPLRAINGFTQILLEDYRDILDDEGKDHLGRIANATNRMGLLIDGLLMLSRVIRRDLHLEECHLSPMASEVAAELKAAQQDRQVTFVIQDGLVVWADVALTRLVLENLLANAWKFTRHRKRTLIEFGSRMGEDGEVFFVRDNGIGFDMQDADMLFQPFHRLHSRDEYEGMGIGLATVQRIVFNHGGKVWAEGRPNVGATVCFTLGPVPVSMSTKAS